MVGLLPAALEVDDERAGLVAQGNAEGEVELGLEVDGPEGELDR